MQDAENEVETQSKVRAWWLRKTAGYSVERVSWKPRLSMFGQVTYDCVYTLGIREEEDPPTSEGHVS
jgi:hypothetical protein